MVKIKLDNNETVWINPCHIKFIKQEWIGLTKLRLVIYFGYKENTMSETHWLRTKEFKNEQEAEEFIKSLECNNLEVVIQHQINSDIRPLRREADN